jgi:pimeloyl-ACP methyl ester carboxylesterase
MRGYVDTSAGQVHYRLEGESGPDMVLLHCANFSSNLYERTLPLLGRRLRAWAFDAPGVGLSDAPPAPTIPQIAGWLLEALDALGIRRPVIAGLHTGCRIGLQMAQIRGADTFAAAVFMGIGPLDAAFRQKYPPRGPHLYIEPDEKGSQWAEAIERYHTIYPDQNPPTEEKGWLQHLFALSSVSKIVPMRMPWPGGPTEGSGLDPVFRAFAAPMLLLNTPEDLFAETDAEMATWNPNAELRLVTGVGPHLMLREPERYADEVLSFLDARGVLTGRQRVTGGGPG